jgi:hypothetical protein
VILRIIDATRYNGSSFWGNNEADCWGQPVPYGGLDFGGFFLIYTSGGFSSAVAVSMD